MLGCRAEDAAADAHREVLADNLLQLLGAVLAREHIEGRHPLGPGHMHGTVDIRAALEQQANHRGAAAQLEGFPTGPNVRRVARVEKMLVHHIGATRI